MQGHNFLSNLNNRRADANSQLTVTIEDLLKQVEDLREQLKQSQDASQRESGAEGIAKEAAKAVVRATKMLMATYGSEGVQLFREHLNGVIDDPNEYDGDWTPIHELPELPEVEEDAKIEDLEPAPAPSSNGNGKVETVEVEVSAEVVEDDSVSNAQELDFSGFKTVRELKQFAADYIDVRRKTRRKIEEQLRQALKDQGVKQSDIEQRLHRFSMPGARK
ncbi:MAG: hypothetical protein F6K58_29490 [Symploca sp. SIO2E9]|nr:hypothetical protein [Symploca sp. SIO2E9]